MSASSPAIIFPAPGRFVNNDETAVIDSLLGLVLSNPDVGLLDIGKVVVRRNYVETDTVRIVSGGASGHDPAHAGFVGMGMLTAAVQGDIFCSPTLTDILETLRELNYKHDAGILVIAQNNTSDRLNFGLAVERARSQGIPVEILVVSDDCCLVDVQQGKRGSSGIILLNKIAGAMAELGRSLEEIFAFCKRVHDSMSSMLFCLRPSSSVSPGTCICARQIGGNEMEIGAGLRGEIGLTIDDKIMVKRTCKSVLHYMSIDNFKVDATTPIVVLINNLGSALQMEELVFTKEFVTLLQELQIPIARVYHGRFLTALDMKGFSVTILKVSEPKVLEYLDTPCEAPAWGKAGTKHIPTGLEARLPVRVAPSKRPMAPGLRLQEVEANIVLLVLQFACDALISCEKQLNTIDMEVGSGNVGSKLKWGSQTILAEVKKKTLNYHNPRIMFAALSVIAEKMVTGTLGVLYSIMFEAAGNYFRKLSKQHEVSANTWLNCLENATDALQSCVKVEFGSGTMYDPLHSCRTAMATALENRTGGVLSFGLGVAAAEEAAIQTRQEYRKYPDPGAHAVGIWMRAVYEGIKMKCEEQSDVPFM